MASTGEGYYGVVHDAGTDTFTAKAAGVISGGNWVTAGSNTLAANLSLSGGTVVWDSDYINVTVGGSGTTRPIGMALETAASGTYLTILRRGIVICGANGTVTAGANVAATSAANGRGCVADAAGGSPSFNASDVIGIALTPQTSGTNYFAAVELSL